MFHSSRVVFNIRLWLLRRTWTRTKIKLGPRNTRNEGKITSLILSSAWHTVKRKYTSFLCAAEYFEVASVSFCSREYVYIEIFVMRLMVLMLIISTGAVFVYSHEKTAVMCRSNVTGRLMLINITAQDPKYSSVSCQATRDVHSTLLHCFSLSPVVLYSRLRQIQVFDVYV